MVDTTRGWETTSVSGAKALIRRHRPKYHGVMIVVYVVTAVPIWLWYRSSVGIVIAISIETALATHVAGWAAEEAAR